MGRALQLCQRYPHKHPYINAIAAANVVHKMVNEKDYVAKKGATLAIFYCNVCQFWHIGNEYRRSHSQKDPKPKMEDLPGQLALFSTNKKGVYIYPKWSKYKRR